VTWSDQWIRVEVPLECIRLYLAARALTDAIVTQDTRTAPAVLLCLVEASNTVREPLNCGRMYEALGVWRRLHECGRRSAW